MDHESFPPSSGAQKMKYMPLFMESLKNFRLWKKLESIRNFTYLYFIRIKPPLVSTPRWQTIMIQAREKCLWIHQGKRARLERKTPRLQQRERRLGGPRQQQEERRCRGRRARTGYCTTMVRLGVMCAAARGQPACFTIHSVQLWSFTATLLSAALLYETIERTVSVLCF